MEAQSYKMRQVLEGDVFQEELQFNKAYLNAGPAVLYHQLERILFFNFSNNPQCHRQCLEYIYSSV